MRRLLFLLAGLLLFSGRALATVSGGVIFSKALPAGYYVSPHGSDSNAGTLAAPFLTLGHCQTTMESGNKYCYIRAGSYALPSGGLVLTTSDNGETFQYYPPDGVGSATLTTGSVSASTFAITNSCVGCTINGLTLVVSGNVTSYIAVGMNAANNTKFINNIINGNAGAGTLYLMDFYNANTTNVLIAGNTFENFGTSSGGDAIWFNNALTNSVIKNNNFYCIAQYAIFSSASASNTNIIYNNTFTNGGHVGGSTPPTGCTSVGGGGGADWAPGASSGNLFVGNTTSGNIGYSVVINNAAGANYVENNTLENSGNPVITVNNSTTFGQFIRGNNITSPGGNGSNIGTEHDSCPEGSSDSVFYANNTIASQYEPIWITASVNGTFQGNTGNIGIETVTGSPTGSNHEPAGIMIVSKAFDESCSSPVYSTGNTILGNNFNSNNTYPNGSVNTNSKYGTYIDAGSSGSATNTTNAYSYNILYPFGPTGTAAVQDNSGATGGNVNTFTNNQITSSNANLATMPPLANAGAGSIVANSQVVTLSGSASVLPGGSLAGVTYAWTQTVGTTVTINNASSATANFTAPSGVTSAALLGFKLTVTTTNGSTSDYVFFGEDPSL